MQIRTNNLVDKIERPISYLFRNLQYISDSSQFFLEYSRKKHMTRNEIFN